MKKLFTLIAVLLCALTLTYANAFTNYKDHIAKDRLLVIFNEGTTAERKAEIINAAGCVSSFTHLPSPQLSVCMVTDYDKASRYFASAPGVKFVSFFITDGQHYAGVMNDYFVKIADKSFEPLLRAKLEREHLGTATADKYIPNLYHLINTQSLNTVEVCAGFLNEGWCSYAAPNYLLNPEVCSNDPLYNRQWALENNGTSLQGNGTADADMDVDSAWMITTGDPNLKIAVVDAGVDTLHPDLVANILPGHDAVGDSTDGYPTPNYANDGHGTCCAGIIAAVKDNNAGIAGVAPSCKIVPIRSFYYVLLQGASDPLPVSTAAIFADAIGWAWSDAGADILSNSWGLPDTLIPFLPGGMAPVDDAIHTCFTQGRNGKGCPMFFSSGNDDAPEPIWPSKLTETIAVGASSMCDERKNPNDCSSENWWGGDYGNGLDFSAPGVKIASTDIRGGKGFSNNDYYYSFNGTSAACPNAAGVGALVMTLRPDASADDIRNMLAQSADRVGGYNYGSVDGNGTYSFELGHGRVNANRAVHFAFDYSTTKNERTENGWQVFPNPANDYFIVKVQAANAEMKLFDLAGRLVMQQKLDMGANSVDGSALPVGMYVVQLTIGSNVTTGKVNILR